MQGKNSAEEISWWHVEYKLVRTVYSATPVTKGRKATAHVPNLMHIHAILFEWNWIRKKGRDSTKLLDTAYMDIKRGNWFFDDDDYIVEIYNVGYSSALHSAVMYLLYWVDLNGHNIK